MRAVLLPMPADFPTRTLEDRANGYTAVGITKADRLGVLPAPPFIDPVTLQGCDVPPRRWIVEGLIPASNVTMLAGDGGLGKSLLALQLLTGCSSDPLKPPGGWKPPWVGVSLP